MICMSFVQSEPEIPTWLAGTVAFLFVASLAYGVIILQQILLVVVFWGWLVGIGASLFLVYLFYRLVRAVETIAEKL